MNTFFTKSAKIFHLYLFHSQVFEFHFHNIQIEYNHIVIIK